MSRLGWVESAACRRLVVTASLRGGVAGDATALRRRFAPFGPIALSNRLPARGCQWRMQAGGSNDDAKLANVARSWPCPSPGCNQSSSRPRSLVPWHPWCPGGRRGLRAELPADHRRGSNRYLDGHLPASCGCRPWHRLPARASRSHLLVGTAIVLIDIAWCSARISSAGGSLDPAPPAVRVFLWPQGSPGERAWTLADGGADCVEFSGT